MDDLPEHLALRRESRGEVNVQKACAGVVAVYRLLDLLVPCDGRSSANESIL